MAATSSTAATGSAPARRGPALAAADVNGALGNGRTHTYEGGGLFSRFGDTEHFVTGIRRAEPEEASWPGSTSPR
jgi:hypothetical protein